LLKTADNRPQTTAHLIELQTLFYSVTGEKADDHKLENGMNPFWLQNSEISTQQGKQLPESGV
jgi:hypothetical protein